MNLRSYLEQENISLPRFAAEINVSYPALHRYVCGLRVPRSEIMQRISIATQGCVEPNDFYQSKAARL